MDDIPVPLPSTPTRFMDKFRAFIRARQLAYRTEKTYCLWLRGVYSLSRETPPGVHGGGRGQSVAKSPGKQPECGGQYPENGSECSGFYVPPVSGAGIG